MPKADIDFEKELWDAANELRGAGYLLTASILLLSI